MTPQQKRLYDIICAEVSANGFCPSFEEMRERMGLASKSGIHRILGGLEERGYIRRLPHRARAIEIIKELSDPLEAFHDCREILNVVRAAKGIKKAPPHKEPCVSITENSYQALQKALAKLRAV